MTDITPDTLIYVEWGFVKLNATLVFTWVVMIVLALGSWLVTRRLKIGPPIPPWQNMLETIVSLVRDQIREVTDQEASPYLPFIGTLFLFIAASNLLVILPGFQPPTGSLSTTTALALCVFFAIPIFGIGKRGVIPYLKHYLEPTPFMLPFQIISEISRTVALAVRLFGNVMSGSLIVAIIFSILPLFVPIIMQMLGLVIGFIQAYIFAILAMVYIASATRVYEEEEEKEEKGQDEQQQPGKAAG
ncbi:MAG: F0F1 ATP synthase subunit A [Anaerolineales bacterium]|nr:F0F1 ATP synthase subunit A [Anaerolineales bacterium]